jgi:hypothetical protein
MEMYYVREYTPTCRFLKIINLIIFKNLQLECILHYIPIHVWGGLEGCEVTFNL